MADNLTLLGALVATHNITVDDAVLLADYFDYAEEAGIEPASVMSAVDLALDFFRPPPDIDAKVTAEAESAPEHDAPSCPDCGGEMMDSVDIEQAIDLWAAVRMVADKYAFDRECGEIEEC